MAESDLSGLTMAPEGGRHKLSLFSATILVVANMVGTGIFTTSGFIIRELGNPWAMLGCWALGGLFALAGALCYGELGARHPQAGGDYVFLRESFGGLPAFLSGWISLLVGFSAPIAAAAMACAAYFWAAWGGTPGTGLSWQIHGVTVLTLSPVTLTAGAVILGFSLVHRHSLAPREMRGVLEVGEKAALALFGPWLSHFIAGAIALSLLSLISAMLMTGPRVYQAMARDGLFFTGLSRAGGPYGTPGNAIFLQAALALLMVFTASFENLLIFIGFTLSLFSLLTVAGLMVLRRRQPRPDLPYRTLGYPLTPLFFILCNAWIIIFSLINKPAVSLVGLAAILAGLLLYGFFRRRAVSSQ